MSLFWSVRLTLRDRDARQLPSTSCKPVKHRTFTFVQGDERRNCRTDGTFRVSLRQQVDLLHGWGACKIQSNIRNIEAPRSKLLKLEICGVHQRGRYAFVNTRAKEFSMIVTSALNERDGARRSQRSARRLTVALRGTLLRVDLKRLMNLSKFLETRGPRV